MAGLEPEQVMKQRGGSVLGKKTILKSDHFPGCQNKRLSPQIEGAPNYRQAESLPVHGVAIPTIDGMRNVLKHIGAWKDGKRSRVLWFNLREEPLVYINGRPFVLREVERPFTNLVFTGINRLRLEEMEVRLKHDVLLEAERYINKILVTDELSNGQMVDQWEPVSKDSVKTPLEVVEELQEEGYLFDYERVPVTDERTPEEQDFDILVNKIYQVDLSTDVTFNCQQGRGRTTTGMVIATLIYLNRVGSSGISRNNSVGRIFDVDSSVPDNVSNSEEAIRCGEYAAIRSLTRVLEGGAEGKRQVDKVIDKCSAMQNLREAIATYRNSILRQPDEMKREASLSFFVEYLERYYYLICFAVYIHSERDALSSNSFSQSSFYKWMRARPELYSIIRRLLRRDPMGALGYSHSISSLTVANGRPCQMGVVIALRNGEVLGSQTVLKSDHCPGCQNPCLPEKIEGAPNFREIPGFPVYGVANPTIEGILSVMERIDSSKHGRPVLWHNMREEPVIYINRKPFVLREIERPYKNMLEYTGIDCERVEKMESRLKEDILREAHRHGGSIMVILETEDGHIFDAWEHVDTDSVKTPLEVFQGLQDAGFPIKYARVPITDGKAPKSSDFDTLATNISSSSKDTAFVFNCQMGRGRTTTGTVIACLLKLRLDFGRPLRVLSNDITHEEVDSGSSSGEETCGELVAGTVPGTCPVGSESEKGRALVIDDILLLWKITRLYENGVECREALDAIIDRCSALQNIRQAVLQYWKVVNQQRVEQRVRRVALNRGGEYLERYFSLITFAAYLGSEAFDGASGQGTRMTFKNWLRQRPEVQAMKWSIRLRPGRFFSVPVGLRAPNEFQHGDVVMEETINARNGSVLGKGSILKVYFFPGQRTCKHPQIHGAPNIFKADGFPVYSMATPTIAGAKDMLSYLGTVCGVDKVNHKIILIDLREEVVVYVNGTPFVLRERIKPVDTVKHVGMTGSMVETLEERLKEDVLAEVKHSGGRMLLHREEYDPATGKSSVIGYWENVVADDVKTPAEIYAALKNEGYNITYQRIPLTRQREALAAEVDDIQHCKENSSASYLFVSHTGFGGVAYAMAIICLRLAAGYCLVTQTEGNDSMHLEDLSSYDDEALRMGDYRDILSLTRVLAYGPKSKTDVDIVINKCSGAGHIRNDIFRCRTELIKCSSADDEQLVQLMDTGIKALRRYFFLIAFKSYLYCTKPCETNFTAWMQARPELTYLCNNLRIDK